jgi:hypothetical protein
VVAPTSRCCCTDLHDPRPEEAHDFDLLLGFAAEGGAGLGNTRAARGLFRDSGGAHACALPPLFVRLSRRSLFDRTLQKIEAAKVLSASTGSGEFDPLAVRRVATAPSRVREVQFAKS